MANWSNIDLQNFYARRAQKLPELPPPKSNHRERDLHEAILAACRLRGWICLHGAMIHRTFRPEGEWDFTILGDRARTFFIEAKSRDGKLTQEQAGLQRWAAKLGHTIHVVRSMKEFYQLIA
jgi:hypothetical protein